MEQYCTWAKSPRNLRASEGSEFQPHQVLAKMVKLMIKTCTISSCTCHPVITITSTHLLTGMHKSEGTSMVIECPQLMPTPDLC